MLAPVSKNPLPIPIIADEAISAQRFLNQGIAPILMPIDAKIVKNVEYGLHLSKTVPPSKFCKMLAKVHLILWVTIPMNAPASVPRDLAVKMYEISLIEVPTCSFRNRSVGPVTEKHSP